MTRPEYRFVYMTTPVGRSEVMAQVLTTGRLRSKHVRNLIRMLEIDAEFLEADEREALPRFPMVHDHAGAPQP